ncbi:MAG: PAS domain-containing protein [Spirochaetes bacterium]|nr:PAS domain-containing protein [Spirochaetota bacterium]
MINRRLLIQFLFYVPDIILGSILYFLHHEDYFSSGMINYIILILIVYLAVKVLLHIWVYKVFVINQIESVRRYIHNFKKGKFSLKENELRGQRYLSEIINELTDVGRHFENMVASQKDEIDKFKEFYNNIVLSVSSYFLVINQKNEIIFANKSFSTNFNLANEDIVNNSISDLFYFSGGKIADAIENVKKKGESIVLRQTRLLSKNRIAIIADVKISRITMQGENQIVLVMDDITSKCRKDYQISLISQISESIQKDDEIDRVLFSILTAVTSGSGLGFNRAMLFLYDLASETLDGKMAVGPDSIEEAVQIWGAVQGEKIDIVKKMEDYSPGDRKGGFFLEQVLSKHYKYTSDALFVKVLKEQRAYHIKDAWNDTRVDPDTREFVGVGEFIAVPLVAGNRSIGIIVADNKYNHAPIWQDNIELLSIFTVQAALSIESCKSLTTVRNQMEKIKLRQDAIVESEKMAAVGRIAAHIAHEIRNPLVTVGGYAQRIIQTVNKGLKNPESIKNAASVILKESERLEKILSNVMDFTRPSPYIREFNNLNEIINDTVSLLQNVFQERKITIQLFLEKEIPLVKSDFNQLKQVMLNLVQNAMDATPQDGVIKISTEIDGDKVIIRVKDTGSGIDEDHLKNLFEPFFTTKVTGVGLGLAVVRKIINDHNGEITAVNNPEGGAEFRIILPVPI